MVEAIGLVERGLRRDGRWRRGALQEISESSSHISDSTGTFRQYMSWAGTILDYDAAHGSDFATAVLAGAYPEPVDPEDVHAWRYSASCRGLGPDDFYDPDDDVLRLVLRVCAACPVRVECLEAALVEEAGRGRHYRFGIRGGLTPGQRVRVAA